MDFDEDELLAFHEAGHAVIAWSLKVKVHHARMGSDEGIVAHRDLCLYFDPIDSLEYHVKAKKLALIALGGRVAEKAFLEIRGYEPVSHYDHFDTVELADLAHEIYGDNATSSQNWIAECEQEADQIIATNFDRLEALAKELMRSRSLMAEDIEKILGTHPKQRWPL